MGFVVRRNIRRQLSNSTEVRSVQVFLAVVYVHGTYASLGLQLVEVACRVGVARRTTLPETASDGDVGGRGGAERQQVGGQQNEERVRRVPHVGARLRPRLLAHRHPHSLRHLYTSNNTPARPTLQKPTLERGNAAIWWEDGYVQCTRSVHTNTRYVNRFLPPPTIGAVFLSVHAPSSKGDPFRVIFTKRKSHAGSRTHWSAWLVFENTLYVFSDVKKRFMFFFNRHVKNAKTLSRSLVLSLSK